MPDLIPGPTCPKCGTPAPVGALTLGQFQPCAGCGGGVWAEVFPALNRPMQRGTAGETVLLEGEAVCFYHEGKKAAEVCHACGRFLCGLCDCPLNGKHYCPGCLNTGQKKGKIRDLENTRVLYGRQAFVMSLVPLYLTGIGAVYLALRYRKAPDSLVTPRPWQMPVALVLGLIQSLGFTILIGMAMFG